MAVEREIKFAIETQDDWRRLKNLTSIGSYTLGPERRVLMVDSYADVDGAVIEDAGYAFRIRQVDDRFLATLKGLDRPANGRHVRVEVEQVIRDPAAGVSDWPDGEVTSMLASLAGRRNLHVHTRLELVKLKRDLAGAGRLIGEWSLDELQAPDLRPGVVLREVEVELKQDGDDTMLDEIAAALTGLGLRQLDATKLDRIRALKLDSAYK